jgi:hypothetical protein
MLNNDYRTMFNIVIGPILNYFGFHLNNDGVIQKLGGNVGITLSGKHLYVPKDGYDYFNTKDSTLLVPFNPFKIREHTIILTQFLCSAMSDKFRDEDDPLEYNPQGDIIDIVTLAKRHAKTEDRLPAQFNGVIYELWCRDETDVIGFGIDHDGNDIKAILMTMIDALSKYSHLVEKEPNFDRIFRYIERVEHVKDLEVEDARAKHATNNQQVGFSSGFDEVELATEEESNSENNSQTKVSDIPTNLWDEMEF